MSLHPRMVLPAGVLLGVFILAEAAIAETYTFVNRQTGERVQAECDTDPKQLTLVQRNDHCRLLEPYSAQFYKGWIELNSVTQTVTR